MKEHLESRYGIAISQLDKLDEGVYRVDRRDGPPWVARIFLPDRPVQAIEGDAAFLRFLEGRDYPAERCAHPEPVSISEGCGMLVTEFVDGVPPADEPETDRRLGDLLGRLQTLADPPAAVTRPAGALHHWTPQGGGPAADLAAATAWLDEVEPRVPPAHRPQFDSLRADIARTDDCADLPVALLHPDMIRRNVVSTAAGDLVAFDWTGAGRGPRIAPLGLLLYSAAVMPALDLARIDGVVAGYRAHVTLADDEWAKLEHAIRRLPLVFACWLFCGAIRVGGPPPVETPWWPRYDLADAIADRARQHRGER